METEKEGKHMAVMSTSKPIVPILSEKNTKKILSMPVNKNTINKMCNVSNKIRAKGSIKK